MISQLILIYISTTSLQHHHLPKLDFCKSDTYAYHFREAYMLYVIKLCNI
jgi:hypothetical protein